MHESHIGESLFTSPEWPRGRCQASRTQVGDQRFYRHALGVHRRGATWLSEKIMNLFDEGKFLDSWRDDMTAQLGGDPVNFRRWMNGVADYGTLNHVLLDDLVKNRLTVEMIEKDVATFCQSVGLSTTTARKAAETAKKNMIAVQLFFDENEVEVLALEQVVTSGILETTTPIDIIARGTARVTKGAKAQPCLMLLNFKTSKNGGASSAHGWQCAIERYCFRATFEEAAEALGLPVVIGTLRPTDWRGDPKPCEFENYTTFADDLETIETLESVAGLLQRRGLMKPPKNAQEIVWSGPLKHETAIQKIQIFD